MMKFLLLFIVRISILISKKGSEKGSDSVDFYCNVVKFRISRIALNQGFYCLVTCSESLFHLSKNELFLNTLNYLIFLTSKKEKIFIQYR